jgi:hypothetical protein
MQKENYPKDPMTCANGGLNNNKIALKGVVIKKKKNYGA